MPGTMEIYNQRWPETLDPPTSASWVFETMYVLPGQTCNLMELKIQHGGEDEWVNENKFKIRPPN